MVNKTMSYYDISVFKELWAKLLKVIMEYFTLDGRLTRVYGHHFVLLNHFLYGIKVSLPFYLMFALRDNFRDHKKELCQVPYPP